MRSDAVRSRVADRLPPGRPGVPYFRADVRVDRLDGEIHVQCARQGDRSATFAAVAHPDPAGEFTPEPETLPGFLTDRYRFYMPRSDPVDEAAGADDPIAGTVAHGPWRLQPASVTVRDASIFRASGVPRPPTEPIAYYSPAIDSVAARVDPRTWPDRLTKS